MTKGERRARFASLASMIPRPGESQVMDDQMRAVLRPLIDRILHDIRDQDCSRVEPNPRLCPNCDVPVESLKSPYCSPHCKEMCGFIRQFRGSFENAQILDPERQIGLAQAFWNMQGGGFPRRQAMVTPKIIAKVIEREGGKCARCGAPATEVEHIRSACNRPINLLPVCSPCNRAHLFGDPNYDRRSEVSPLYDEVALRIFVPEVVRVCDDFELWDWRAYVAERRALLIN